MLRSHNLKGKIIINVFDKHKGRRSSTNLRNSKRLVDKNTEKKNDKLSSRVIFLGKIQITFH